MRTSREIANWLKEQDWFERFRANTEKVCGSRSLFYKDIMRGHNGFMTIFGAFDWISSPEGREFWYGVNIVFIHWLEGGENHG